MYSRNYGNSSGAVKAFEDAYAKEEFLRRSAVNGESPCHTSTQNTYSESTKKAEHSENCEEKGICVNTPEEKLVSLNNDTAKQKKGFAGLFSNYDSGDIILLLLIVFFLFDSDSENDSLIPILLTVLLLF